MSEDPEGDRAAWAAEVETHRVIKGRRWRVTDPRIPEPQRQALVDELMSARRAVRAAGGDPAAERAARDRVHDAKVALGERGERWWRSVVDHEAVADRIRRTDRALRATEQEADAAGSDAARWAAVAEVVSRSPELVREVLSQGAR